MESEASGKAEELTSQVLTYLTLTLSVVALVRYLLTSRPPANIPPLPAKPYFLVGHLPYFKKGTRKMLAEWSNSLLSLDLLDAKDNKNCLLHE
ncbi:hypothetical protein ElyMa_001106000 [Elysia marginata]|uniref:Cytochrome P450 n=1 Tax=Elysia marginata TaxID=1093978 RepID=A0AAV4HWD6_9GAST|nr:hypothetical protein ElyMa_001106000 [Elysia marginata]